MAWSKVQAPRPAPPRTAVSDHENRASPLWQGREALCPVFTLPCFEIFVSATINHVFHPVLRVPGDLILLEKVMSPPRLRSRLKCPLGTEDSGWRIRKRSLLLRVDGPLRPELKSLAAAWKRLAGATDSASSLADLLLVLRFTVSASGQPAEAPRLDRGPVDLRPVLNCGKALRQVLEALSRHWSAALVHLRRAGIEGKDWRGEGGFLTENPPAVRPRLVAEALHPWMNPGAPTEEESAAFMRMVWDPAPDRTALLVSCVSAGGAGWLSVIAAEPPERHSALLRLLVESGASRIQPPPRVHRLLATLCHLPGRELWTKRVRWAFDGLVKRGNPAWLAATLLWHSRQGLALPELPENAFPPSRRVLHLVQRQACRSIARDREALWRRFSTDREAARVAVLTLGTGCRLPEWRQTLLYRFFQLPGDNSPGWARRALFLELLPDLLKAAAGMREDNVHSCSLLLENWIEDVPRPWPGHADDLRYWLGRNAAAEQSLPGRGSWMLACCFGRLRPEGRLLLRSWSDDELKRFARKADGWGFSYDISLALAPDNVPPVFLAHALHRHLREMVEILQALASLNPESREKVWQALGEHPLCACDAALIPLREAVVLLDSVGIGHCGVPDLPASVRRLIASSDTTVPARLEEARGKITRRWWHLAVRVLRQLVDWEMRRGYPGLRDGNLDLHTLCMVRGNTGEDENAGAYRQILRAIGMGYGHRAWALEMPLNQAWLKTHPLAASTAWSEGFAVAVKIPGEGEIVLSLEDDLQEILRMGTRFGTCLSFGGCNSHSPAAVALDANKRVLHARDASGKIIARQLLALSDDGVLVCFAVYVLRHRAALRAAFSTYDLMLAQALRIPVWRSHEEYKISPIVCRNWYDDGAWLFCREQVALSS